MGHDSSGRSQMPVEQLAQALAQATEDVLGAESEVAGYVDAERMARSNLSSARTRLNELQKRLDNLVDDLRSRASRESDWGNIPKKLG